MRKLLSGNRYVNALVMLAVGVLLALLLSVPFYLIGPDARFRNVFLYIYFLFGAPTVPCAFITIRFPQCEAFSYGLACGFYYGGAFIAGLLKPFVTDRLILLLVSFLIAGLACWIYALGELRHK